MTPDPALPALLTDPPELVWWPKRGMGYFPVRANPYDMAYFRRYEAMESTEMGQALIRARADLVNRYPRPTATVLDVGIGAGGFLLHMELARASSLAGYDVSEAAKAWLHSRFWWLDPYTTPVEVATFWDSLEHIPDPSAILANVTRWAFVSMPIYTGPDHVLRSRHFRPDEHFWYWTREGFLRWMGERGWRCREHNTAETLLGREDIETFAFVRVGA